MYERVDGRQPRKEAPANLKRKEGEARKSGHRERSKDMEGTDEEGKTFQRPKQYI